MARECPECPKCSLSCGSTRDPEGYRQWDNLLWCCACGHEWQANESAIEQARRADDAHDHLRTLEELAEVFHATTNAALKAARDRGFKGEDARLVGTWTDGQHAILRVEVRFPGGETDDYAVVHDVHEGGGRPNLVSLSHAVHVLQNVGDEESWRIAARDPAV